MNKIIVNGTEFKFLKWDFTEDGHMGAIYFLIPKGTYEISAKDGAYVFVGEDEGYPHHDLARVACPCFIVNDKYKEDEFYKATLKDIMYTAAKFIDKKIYKHKK